MEVRALGGASEVGRSCFHIAYKGRNILLDCGSHSGRNGSVEESMPLFSLLDPSCIDLILITHFHIDHAASLPYFTEKIGSSFRGKIFATHATKAVMKMLLTDNLRLQPENSFYSEAELEKCIEKVHTIDFYQTFEHRGIKFTPLKAGHVLGAAMFLIEIDGATLLYTGDYSMEDDRHLPCADIDQLSKLLDGRRPDILIVESTHGINELQSREERENRFKNTVESIVKRGGCCLIPIFALGRAQELMLVLEEMWSNQPSLQGVNIFFTSNLAKKALRVFQTFPSSMHENIQTLTDIGNAFDFKHVKELAQPVISELRGPCVVLAPPGFMDNGVSRSLLEAWCDNEKNGVVIVGYSIEGTMAFSLSQKASMTTTGLEENITEVTCRDGKRKPLKCSVEEIPFSAHVSCRDNLSFIHRIAAKNVIFVHGREKQVANIARKLRESRVTLESLGFPSTPSVNGGHALSSRQNGTPYRPMIHTPKVGQIFEIAIEESMAALSLGKAAESILAQYEQVKKMELEYENHTTGSMVSLEGIESKSADAKVEQKDNNNNNNDNDDNVDVNEPKEGMEFSKQILLPSDALLVTESYQNKLVVKSELSSFSNLRTGKIRQRQILPISNELISLARRMQVGGDRKNKVVESNSMSALSTSSASSISSSVEFYMNFLFTSLEETLDQVDLSEDFSSIVIQNQIFLSMVPDSSHPALRMEWIASPLADTLADCVLGVLAQQFTSLNVMASLNSFPGSKRLKVE